MLPSEAYGGTLCSRIYGDLHITNAPMAQGRITIDNSGSDASVQGFPEGMVFRADSDLGPPTSWNRP
jgi:hypothetical protein